MTPKISHINVSGAVESSMITITGEIYPNFDFQGVATPTKEVADLSIKVVDPWVSAANEVQGVSGTRCSFVNPDTQSAYQLSTKTVACVIGGPRVAGFYNISLAQAGYGDAAVAASVYKISPDGQVYMFQQLACVSGGLFFLMVFIHRFQPFHPPF